ncbi:hypothetical protein B0J13DRAFT_604675 [Dactylonectria estremocensis]|uniref:AB hydrolase-1 domain-containing protein n=1 Tax=Dactylonectria estremocensis TaxID=1079267 RepID=A0A9P9JD71_9HYPO|nr:hypothetical protein B0J13DRAFT_604675 [Dactylonectria estremocensis]
MSTQADPSRKDALQNKTFQQVHIASPPQPTTEHAAALVLQSLWCCEEPAKPEGLEGGGFRGGASPAVHHRAESLQRNVAQPPPNPPLLNTSRETALMEKRQPLSAWRKRAPKLGREKSVGFKGGAMPTIWESTQRGHLRRKPVSGTVVKENAERQAAAKKAADRKSTEINTAEHNTDNVSSVSDDNPGHADTTVIAWGNGSEPMRVVALQRLQDYIRELCYSNSISDTVLSWHPDWDDRRTRRRSFYDEVKDVCHLPAMMLHMESGQVAPRSLGLRWKLMAKIWGIIDHRVLMKRTQRSSIRALIHETGEYMYYFLRPFKALGQDKEFQDYLWRIATKAGELKRILIQKPTVEYAFPFPKNTDLVIRNEGETCPYKKRIKTIGVLGATHHDDESRDEIAYVVFGPMVRSAIYGHGRHYSEIETETTVVANRPEQSEEQRVDYDPLFSAFVVNGFPDRFGDRSSTTLVICLHRAYNSTQARAVAITAWGFVFGSLHHPLPFLQNRHLATLPPSPAPHPNLLTYQLRVPIAQASDLNILTQVSSLVSWVLGTLEAPTSHDNDSRFTPLQDLQFEDGFARECMDMDLHNARSPSTRPLSPFGLPVSSDGHPHEMESVNTSEFGEDELCSPSNDSKEALCSRTTFFVNSDWRMGSTLANATTIVGQMYVECLDPVKKLHPYPIVLIHGDFHTGQMAKPDGNPGWASYFVRKGFLVYIVDLPPCGRSNFLTASHFIHRDLGRTSHTLAASTVEVELTAPGKEPANGQPLIPLRHSRASMHDKWPGTGQRGDPVFTNYCASLVTLHLNKVERQSLGQNALRALLVKIGRAVLVGEGSGGNMSWLANDVSPELVAGVIAIEPSGPPFGTALPKNGNPKIYTQFIESDGVTRLYGLTDIPLTYDPPCHPHDGFERPTKDPLDVARKLRPDRLGACFLQQQTDADLIEVSSDGKPIPGQQRVRQLIHLKKVPHALITAHASSHTVYDWATVSFMKQAGVDVNWLRLEDFGILGNGHLMFLEVNSDDVAGVVERWILENVTHEIYGAQPVNPITTSESQSLIASRGRTSKKANHARAVHPAVSGCRPTVPVGLSDPALCSLSRHTPLAPVQHQLRNQSATVQFSGSAQMALVHGKRPAKLPSAEKAPAHEAFPGLGTRTSSPSTQDTKRLCIGNGVKARSMSMSSPSGKFPIPQLSQQQHIRAFQTLQGQVHTRTIPKLRQQVQSVTRSGPESPYHTSTTLAPIPRPSTPQGAPLYAHLSGNMQPTTSSSDVPPMALTENDSSGALPQVFKHITFSDESIKSLASTPLHRVMGNPEPTPRSLAHPTAATIPQQVDSKEQPRMNSVPIDPQLSQVSTPARRHTSPRSGKLEQTPLDLRQRDLDSPQGPAFSTLPALTPPSPSPAPRPPMG